MRTGSMMVSFVQSRYITTCIKEAVSEFTVEGAEELQHFLRTMPDNGYMDEISEWPRRMYFTDSVTFMVLMAMSHYTRCLGNPVEDGDMEDWMKLVSCLQYLRISYRALAN